MPSLLVLKTILYNGSVFFNFNKSLSSITAILPVTHSYSGNAIIPNFSST